mmetsp:Transcript_9498/g.28742  ORF Transcript_9498/g.28742 Transcript_9498/m.28742 type:complete len:85 (+) Transcript_9498:1320-1574(+)
MEGSDPTVRSEELEILKASGAFDALAAAAQGHQGAPKLVAEAEWGMANMSEGVVGYMYHSLVASMSSWSIWGSSESAAATTAKA